MESKNCKLCGKTFTKFANYSKKQFEKRKYCGMKCSLEDAGFIKGHTIRKPRRISEETEQKIIDAYRTGMENKNVLKTFSIENSTLFRLLHKHKVNLKNVFGLRLKKNCLHCSIPFERKPHHMKNNNKKGCTFCSKKCADDYKRGKSLKDFFGEEKAKNVTETARRRAKTNPNLKKFEKGIVPWNKGWNTGSYFSEKATENIQKGQLKVAAWRTGKTPEEAYGVEGAKIWRQKQREKMIRTYEEGKIKQANTKPERILKDALTKAGLKEGDDFVHQFRFGNYVYDFAFPKHKELLEVHGDWWHANPAKYPYDPKTKMAWISGVLGASDFKEKPLHQIQIKNIEKDEKKRLFALNNGWRCSFVWEQDVCNEHNLKCIINGIKRILNTPVTSCQS